nr:uncharacterized protein LOC126056107 isoform X2 [Helicoverpa armigera]
MKWTEQHTLKFVQAYIKFECLYNVKCAEFKNKQLRDAALLKLSEAMGNPDFGPKEAYNKIRSLKSTFSQEHKKVKDSIKSGAGLDDIYVPNIKWYKVMDDALKAVNVGECRETSSNMNLESQNKINEDNIEPRGTEGEKAVENSSRVGTSSNDSGQSFKRKNPRKRPTLREYDNLLTKAQNVANSVNSSVVSENEFDLFGRMVAVQLKNLPMESAIEAQQYIQNYLSGLRLKHIRRQSQTSNFIYEMVENRTQPFNH